MRPQDCVDAAGVSEINLLSRHMYLDSGEVLPIVGLYDQKYRETDRIGKTRHCVAGPTGEGLWVTSTVSKLDREIGGR